MERQRCTMELQEQIDALAAHICDELCMHRALLDDQGTLETVCDGCDIREQLIRLVQGLCEPMEQSDAQDRRFAAFWAAYPKKVNRKVARRIWDKLAPSAELTDTIISSVEMYKKTDSWKRGYILDPSTYLNQERWTDEITPEMAKPGVPSGRRPRATEYEQHAYSEEQLDRLLVDLDGEAAGR